MVLANKQMIIEQLKNYCISANFEQTNQIYFPSPIVIGSNKNGNVLCNRIDMNHYDRNGVTLHILFDEIPCELYGNDYDFSYITLYDDGSEEYGKGISDELGRTLMSWKPNVLLEIINFLDKLGMSWISYQTEMQIKERAYMRRVINRKGTVSESLSWEERIERIKLKIEMDKLSNCRKIQVDLNDLKEMLELGQYEYDRLVEKRNNIMMGILNEI